MREPQEAYPPPMREARESAPRPMREPREIPQPPMREPERRGPMAVQQAIEEVNHIIETLRATLDDMEAVLETLELAERQKTADEQEIETLHRGLRQLHHPRDGGQHPPRP
jgi:predicted RNase H-like nuclease (RuvC/YqgF family)